MNGETAASGLLVIGAGQMGAGIAQTAVVAGIAVTLSDSWAPQLERAQRAIEERLQAAVAGGKLDAAAAQAARGRLRVVADWQAAPPAEVVVEAVNEDEGVKRELFARLDGWAPPETVLASNTSSISITRLAGATGHPERVIGMHFMNPVPVMELVEVVRGSLTAPAVVERVVALARAMGKTPVEVADFPGFVGNRILLPMINEAIFALQEGVADRDGIDTVMRLGMRHPMGPLALADLIGLDTCLAILEVLHRGFGDPKYRPAPLLRRMVDAGQLGRKSGRGFYEYPS